MAKFICYDNNNKIVCTLKPDQIEVIECATNGGVYYNGKLAVTYLNKAGFYQQIYVDHINKKL